MHCHHGVVAMILTDEDLTVAFLISSYFFFMIDDIPTQAL